MRVRPEFEAALLWDAPALFHSTYPGARAFHDAMNLRSSRGDYGLSTLGQAARAVFSYYSGEERESRDIALALAESQGTPRLIGLLLSAWLHDLAPAQWDELEASVDSVDKRTLRAHLYTKMFAFAFDSGLSARAIHYFDIASSEASGALSRQLEMIGTNYFEQPFSASREYVGDDLVDLPWVRNRAAEAAQLHINDAVLEQLRVGSSGVGVRYGGGPVAAAAAAEAQATWTGALWFRDGVRKTLSGLILLDSSSTRDQVEEAVALWIASGGKHVADIVGSSEPRFDKGSADRIITESLASELVTRSGISRRLDASLAMWDLLTDEAAAVQLEVIRVSDVRDHELDKLARLWARLLARLPRQVLPKLRSNSLTPRILSFVEPWVVDILDQSDLVELWEIVAGSLQHSSEYPDVVRLAIVLSRRLDFDIPDAESLVSALPPEIQASIELESRGTIPQHALADSLHSVASVVDEQSRKAALGSVSFGGVDSRHLMALLIAAVDEPNEGLVDMLGAMAVQASAPLVYRVGTMRGLLALAQLDQLPDQVIRAVGYMVDEPNAGDVFGSISPSLLRSMRCKLLATTGVDGLATEALSLARHKDVETRLVAVEALSTLAENGEVIAQTALVSTLFDPSPIVVRRGVQGLSSREAWHPEMKGLLLNRLLDLRSSAGVVVREAIASLARRLESGDDAVELEAISSRSRSDRSWLVRTAATFVPTEGE